MSKKIVFSLFLLVLSLGSMSCKNPLKEEKKKELIRVLIHDYFDETGKWIFFWDGKDKNDKYINPGKYIYLLEIRDFQDQDFVTAIEGGKDELNDERRFEPGFWTYTELGEAYPDPFEIRSGVNIPVFLSQPATLKLSIYKD
jgi:hypothetical protein